MIASIIVPIAPYHAEIASRALASAHAQTVPCEVIAVSDTDGRGAGWARNQGLSRATAPFVVFLDADDELDPTFVERCADRAMAAKRYVYTDWRMEDGDTVKAPDQPWVDGTWHTVTTLLPTRWARAVGGFDEALTGAEDTEFYVHLWKEGYRGCRLAEPLFLYGKYGRRSSALKDSPQYHAVMNLITQRYGALNMTDVIPLGGELPPLEPGQVLVRPTWGGQRVERGVVTGKKYPRVDWNDIIVMDARDAEAMPRLYTIITPDEYLFGSFADDVQAMMGLLPLRLTGRYEPPMQPLGEPGEPAPDIRGLLALYEAAQHG